MLEGIKIMTLHAIDVMILLPLFGSFNLPALNANAQTRNRDVACMVTL